MSTHLIGEVAPFRGNVPAGWHSCDGGVLEIVEHQPLFSLLGWRFGGDGARTFALPALTAPSPALTYGIAEQGLYPTRESIMLETPKVGEIRLFAGDQVPAGWIPCDGRMLPVEPPYLDLYEVIGTTWGGDGEAFGLPNLQADEAVGRLSYIVAWTERA